MNSFAQGDKQQTICVQALTKIVIVFEICNFTSVYKQLEILNFLNVNKKDLRLQYTP